MNDPSRFDAGCRVNDPPRFDAWSGARVRARFVNGGGRLHEGQAAGTLAGRLHGVAKHLDQLQVQRRGEKRDFRRQAHAPPEANDAQRRWRQGGGWLKFTKIEGKCRHLRNNGTNVKAVGLCRMLPGDNTIQAGMLSMINTGCGRKRCEAMNWTLICRRN